MTAILSPLPSGNTLSFVYVGSSGDASKPGWHATITCVPELFESPDGSACPSVVISPTGFYEDSPDYDIIDFDCSNPTVMLKATVTATGSYTNDYTVKQIPYDENNMLFAYNQGNGIGATSDDSWLSGVQLPFTFVFFGKPYTTVYPGTNGLISMSPQSGYCTYSYQQPATTPPYSTIQFTRTLFTVFMRTSTAVITQTRMTVLEWVMCAWACSVRTHAVRSCSIT